MNLAVIVIVPRLLQRVPIRPPTGKGSLIRSYQAMVLFI